MRNHAYFFRENFILEEIYFNSFFLEFHHQKQMLNQWFYQQILIKVSFNVIRMA